MRTVILLFAFLCNLLPIRSQTILTASGINPSPNEIFDITFAHDIPPGSPGAFQFWFLPFDSIATVSQFFTSPSNTNWSAPFTSSNVAFPQSGVPFGWACQYFRTDSSVYQYVGDYYPNTGYTVYDDPMDIMHYPLTYLDSFVDTFSYHFTLSTDSHYNHGIRNEVADGYGTVSTPAGIFSNVLRIHITDNITDSIVSSSGTTINDWRIETYRWYMNGNHSPLAEITYDYLNNNLTQHEGHYLQNANTALSENLIANTFEAYPNPASDRVTLSFFSTSGGKCTIRLFDMSGREIGNPIEFSSLPGENRNDFSVLDLKNGIYFSEITGEKRVLSTQKIVVAH